MNQNLIESNPIFVQKAAADSAAWATEETLCVRPAFKITANAILKGASFKLTAESPQGVIIKAMQLTRQLPLKDVTLSASIRGGLGLDVVTVKADCSWPVEELFTKWKAATGKYTSLCVIFPEILVTVQADEKLRIDGAFNPYRALHLEQNSTQQASWLAGVKKVMEDLNIPYQTEYVAGFFKVGY